MTNLRLEAARAVQERKKRLADKKVAEKEQRRKNAPAEKRRREEREHKRQESTRLFEARWEAERRDDKAAPLYEVVVEHIDVTDPQFTALRERLVLTVQRAVAELELSITSSCSWRPLGDQEERRRLTRAREVLAKLGGAWAP